MVDKKVQIRIESDSVQVDIEAYVTESLPLCDLIIGTDMLRRITKVNSNRLIWNLVFGKIAYGPTAAVYQVQENFGNEEDEDYDNMLDMQVSRLASGRFEARLPFISENRPSPNYDQACKLVNNLVVRLYSNQNYQQYRNKFMKYVTSGLAIPVSDIDGYFIPHHAVFKPESQSSPIRIGFNASFGKENSLNNALWKGSVIGLDILPHLIRIRLYPLPWS